MTPVTSPSLGALVANAATSALPQLQLGDVLAGIVIAALDDAVLRLQLPGGTIDVATDVPLAPGTRVTLAVEGTSQQPKLVLSPIPDDPGAPPRPATDLSGARVPTGVTSVGSTRITVISLEAGSPKVEGSLRIAPGAGSANAASNDAPLLSSESPSALGTVASSATTIGRAAARQGGLAPLYADLEAVL